jgi:predicted Zn-dependent peptidase
VDDIRAFFRTYYAPNNAVLVIVGDVDAKVALDKISKAFVSIPSQPPPPRPDLTEPRQTAQRRKVIEDPLVRLPRLDIVYKVPPRLAPDDEAVIALSTVLGGGRSSRLYQRLVREEQLASSVFVARDNVMGTGMFRVIVTPAPGKGVEAAERAVYEEIEKLKAGPIADWEVEKARNSAKRAFVGEMVSSVQRAMQLASYATAFGDPGLINQRLGRFDELTPADLQRAAVTYLTSENRSVLTTVPASAAPKPAGPPAGASKGDER